MASIADLSESPSLPQRWTPSFFLEDTPIRRICDGWHEPKHAPLDLGDKEPLDDPRISHSICPECEGLFLLADAAETLEVKGVSK